MGFQFAETMAGTIEWQDEPGKRQPFRMDLTAIAESTRDYIQTRQALLRGVVHAPPRIGSSDCEGVITISPIIGRIIRYELTFTGDDGEIYELAGQKDISFLRPVYTFTHLPAEVRDESGRVVATCATTFDARHDLWSFLRSFRPA